MAHRVHHAFSIGGGLCQSDNFGRSSILAAFRRQSILSFLPFLSLSF